MDYNFSLDSLKPFLKARPLKQYAKESPIFYQGEVPQTAYIIKDGVVRVYGITPQGEEKIINYLTPGDPLPVSWLFSHSPVSMYYYSAFTDCTVYVVGKEELHRQITNNAPALKDLFELFLARDVGASIHVHALEQSRAQDKIMRILQFLIIRFGKETTPGVFLINLRLTHQELANMVGLTRETTAVEVGRLKKRGVLTYEKSQYRINYDSLLRSTKEDEFKDVTL